MLRTHVRQTSFFVLCFVCGIGCTAIVGVDRDYRAAAADSGVVGTEGGTADGGVPIEAAAAPRLLPVNGGWSVGETEVTRAAYESWVATSPSLAGQPAACDWNTTFAPDTTCLTLACTDPDCTRHPQVCVDWCDAFAYCAAQGQRLCGKIGGDSEALDDYKTSASSQWYSACSDRGKRMFPYGDTYDPNACNGGDRAEPACDGGSCSTVPVGSLAGCAASTLTFDDKLFDLSGNAWEWANSCDVSGAGRNQPCRIRGGSYRTPEAKLRCAGEGGNLLPRATASPDVGFRCCSP